MEIRATLSLPGLAAIAACALVAGCGGSGNVSFADQCEFSACGGDPTGSWRYVAACVENYDGSDSDCSSPKGDISGTLIITETGHSIEREYELVECGFFTESSLDGGGSAAVNGSEITIGGDPFEFCVDQDQLRLRQVSGIELNDPTTYTLERDGD
jgi:hypothetical protein